jgi:hypothetical protein
MSTEIFSLAVSMTYRNVRFLSSTISCMARPSAKAGAGDGGREVPRLAATSTLIRHDGGDYCTAFGYVGVCG